MASYRGTVDGRARARAWAAVVLVHALLAAIIVTGLNVRSVRHVVERLQTIDIRLPPPPEPPAPPPAEREAKRARLEQGAAGKKSEPTEVVAPLPPLPQPSPIIAAPVAGTGLAPSAGAAANGTGPGAGGSGSGRGGGGNGDFSGFTPARLVRNLSRADYRRIAADRSPVGNAAMTLAINNSGRVTGCRIARSSGEASVDAVLCELVTERLLFRPALDDRGRPIAYRLTYVATWNR